MGVVGAVFVPFACPCVVIACSCRVACGGVCVGVCVGVCCGVVLVAVIDVFSLTGDFSSVGVLSRGVREGLFSLSDFAESWLLLDCFVTTRRRK